MAEHSIKLTERKQMELTGVTNVVTFDEQEIIMETILGNIFILGEGLHITMLNLDEGKVALEGAVNSIEYKSQGTDLKTRSRNILSRLLK